MGIPKFLDPWEPVHVIRDSQNAVFLGRTLFIDKTFYLQITDGESVHDYNTVDVVVEFKKQNFSIEPGSTHNSVSPLKGVAGILKKLLFMMKLGVGTKRFVETSFEQLFLRCSSIIDGVSLKWRFKLRKRHNSAALIRRDLLLPCLSLLKNQTNQEHYLTSPKNLDPASKAMFISFSFSPALTLMWKQAAQDITHADNATSPGVGNLISSPTACTTPSPVVSKKRPREESGKKSPDYSPKTPVKKDYNSYLPSKDDTKMKSLIGTPSPKKKRKKMRTKLL